MDTNDRKRKVATVLKWLGGMVVVAAISPITFLAAKGALGLLAFGAAAGVGIIGLKLAPLIGMKVSNLVVKGVIAEAEANPIETMENLKIEKTKELQEATKNIVEFEAEVGNFDDQVQEFAQQYPDDTPKFRQIAEKMHEALANQKAKHDEMEENLADLSARIERARAIYKMALAAQKVTAFSKSAEQIVFAEIREKVAFEAVKKKMNMASAALNMALSERRPAPPLMLGGKPETIGELPSKDKVRVLKGGES